MRLVASANAHNRYQRFGGAEIGSWFGVSTLGRARGMGETGRALNGDYYLVLEASAIRMAHRAFAILPASFSSSLASTSETSA